MENIPPASTSGETSARPRLNWLIVIGLLLGPGIVALIGASTKVDAIAVGSPLAGGAVGGIIFGVMAGRRFGKTVLAKILLGACCAAVFGCLTFGIGFFGCAMGGFQLDMR